MTILIPCLWILVCKVTTVPVSHFRYFLHLWICFEWFWVSLFPTISWANLRSVTVWNRLGIICSLGLETQPWDSEHQLSPSYRSVQHFEILYLYTSVVKRIQQLFRSLSVRGNNPLKNVSIWHSVMTWLLHRWLGVNTVWGNCIHLVAF